MLTVKLVSSLFLGAFWSLTLSGQLGVSSYSWFVILIGLTTGTIFGWIEMKYTHGTRYCFAVWSFIGDSTLVLILCTYAVLWKVSEFGTTLAWFVPAVMASYSYLGFPRPLSEKAVRRVKVA